MFESVDKSFCFCHADDSRYIFFSRFADAFHALEVSEKGFG